MKTYAYIVDGSVFEVIHPIVDADGNEIPISERYHPDFVAQLQALPDGQTVAQGFAFSNGVFSAPKPLN